MADTKISALTALTGANTASDDLLVIVDTSATETKKITLTELQSAPFSAGTANGILYLNGSKVASSGSALTFDGANLVASGSVRGSTMQVSNSNGLTLSDDVAGGFLSYGYNSGRTNAAYHAWYNGITSELMRLTPTGLGIGTSSPSVKLDIRDTTSNSFKALSISASGGGADAGIRLSGAGGNAFRIQQPNTSAGLIFYDETNAATRLTIDASGNLGLGVTPSAWRDTFKALQIGARGALWSSTSTGSTFASNNVLYDAVGFKYIGTAAASSYEQSAGAHYWYSAPSGTAGDAISFTQAMTLTAAGRLGLGRTSLSGLLDIAESVAAGYSSFFHSNDDATGYVQHVFSVGTGGSNSQASINYAPGILFAIGPVSGDTTTPIIFRNNNATERARFTAAGDFIHQVNATAPTLSTNGTMSFELTSNTSLKIVVRGSDGTTRSASLTLA